MDCTEFKKRASELINISNVAEKKRFKIMSRKRLQRAGVNFRNIETNEEVIVGWKKYNKNEADWEKYCRQAKHNARLNSNSSFTDYSHLAYSGVTDDF